MGAQLLDPQEELTTQGQVTACYLNRHHLEGPSTLGQGETTCTSDWQIHQSGLGAILRETKAVFLLKPVVLPVSGSPSLLLDYLRSKTMHFSLSIYFR